MPIPIKRVGHDRGSGVYFALLVVLLVVSVLKPDRLIPGLGFLGLLPMVLLVFLFMAWLAYPDKILGNKQTQYYFWFALLVVLGTLLARNQGYAYPVTRGFLFGYLGYLVQVTFLNSFEKVDRFIRLNVILQAIVAAMGLSQGGRIRRYPALDDENDFALLMNVTLPFAFFLGQASTSLRDRTLYYGMASLFILADAVSLSRGGFLGLCAVFFYCWWCTSKKFTGTLLIAGGIGVVFLLASAAYWNEVTSILGALEDTNSDSSSRDRLYSWKIGWAMFLDYPILGVGPGNYKIWFSDYDLSQMGARHWGRAAHSLYIDLLSENGVIGVGIFLALFMANLNDHRLITRLEKEKPLLLQNANLTAVEKNHVSKVLRIGSSLSHASLCALVTFLVTGAFISVLHYPYFWSLAATFVMLRNAVIREMSKTIGELKTSHAH